jgi:AraC-like DNA-binding protein
MDYIKQRHLSFSEIGYLVGFSCVGNFNRAFKRWTQVTPGEYRHQYFD